MMISDDGFQSSMSSMHWCQQDVLVCCTYLGRVVFDLGAATELCLKHRICNQVPVFTTRALYLHGLHCS